MDVFMTGVAVTLAAYLGGSVSTAYLLTRMVKGVATIFGLSLAVLPLLTMLSAALALAFGLATRNVVFGIAAGVVPINVLTVSTGQGAAQIGLCLTLSAVVFATHFALDYREVLASVRVKGVWGLFDVE